ncbi:MAG: histidinol-phosphate transaminase [Lachnospiraceae bacterium]|nr:histidinol-phosphate transaminase [Lachnospiraceae bacterium]
MKNSWEANVRKVTPYTPGDQPNRPKMIKLNTNENPYPPAPGVTRALKEFRTDQLRLYPDPKSSELLEVIAAQYQVKPEQVFVGVGSDDVLALAFLTFFHSEKPVLFPDISYSFYPVWAEVFRIPYETPALDEHFRIVKEDYYRENGGVVFPNPNAPTSLAMGRSDVEDIVRRNPDSVVIVDEAYVDFGAESAVRLTDTYENLLVVQTFSKSRSMAGMRIGFAIGSPLLIRYLNDVKYSFNSYTMNRLTLRLGVEAVLDQAYFQETTAKIVKTREQAKKRLQELGFCCLDSRTNFLFVTHPEYQAKGLYEALKQEDIYVRYFALPRIDNYLRVTIGTEEQMEALYVFLERYMSRP